MEFGGDAFQVFGEGGVAVCVEGADAVGDVDLGSQFCGGAFGYVQKADEVRARVRSAPSAMLDAMDTAARVI